MYRMNWMMTLALAGAAAPLAAQDPQPGQPKTQVRIERDGSPMWKMSGDMENMMMTRRVRLGIKVNLQARASDSIGAYVEAVTPGGPAAKAGLEAGDIITKLDGTSLVTNGKQGSADRSLPGMRLIELAARLTPNDTISVDYRRGKDRKSATLVTQPDPDNVFVMTSPDGDREFTYSFRSEGPDGLEGPLMPGMDMQQQMEMLRGPLGPGVRMPMDGGDTPFRVFFSSELEALELVPLNPDLAPYFGASDGVLVINVPKGSTLGLKGGDVVLMIDGRKPSNTAQMHRILRSYDPGNTVKFEILRNKKTTTVSGTIPKAPEMKWRTSDSAKARPGSM
jgi:membrane-associated protease RseP (regulator of RpoE activity)